MENKVYFYDDEYYSLEEISNKYSKLAIEQKKPFKDALAHFTLVQILKKCDYDEKIIECIIELAGLEASIISMYGCDCGNVPLALRGLYKRNLKKLNKLIGKMASKDDFESNKFTNGEWLLNNLVCLTIGSSFKEDIVDNLYLIDYSSISEDECKAISDNFLRNMRGEEILFYNESKVLKK